MFVLMKRLTVTIVLMVAFLAVLPNIGYAQTAPPIVTCSQQYTNRAMVNYAARIFAGSLPVSTASQARLRAMESCALYPRTVWWVQRYSHSLYLKHAKRVADAKALAAEWSSSDLSLVPGVPASFADCVAGKESTHGAGGSNIYGIIGASGYGDMTGQPLVVQKQTFARVYHDLGPSAWTSWEPPPPCA